MARKATKLPTPVSSSPPSTELHTPPSALPISSDVPLTTGKRIRKPVQHYGKPINSDTIEDPDDDGTVVTEEDSEDEQFETPPDEVDEAEDDLMGDGDEDEEDDQPKRTRSKASKAKVDKKTKSKAAVKKPGSKSGKVEIVGKQKPMVMVDAKKKSLTRLAMGKLRTATPTEPDVEEGERDTTPVITSAFKAQMKTTNKPVMAKKGGGIKLLPSKSKPIHISSPGKNTGVRPKPPSKRKETAQAVSRKKMEEVDEEELEADQKEVDDEKVKEDEEEIEVDEEVASNSRKETNEEEKAEDEDVNNAGKGTNKEKKADDEMTNEEEEEANDNKEVEEAEEAEEAETTPFVKGIEGDATAATSEVEGLSQINCQSQAVEEMNEDGIEGKAEAQADHTEEEQSELESVSDQASSPSYREETPSPVFTKTKGKKVPKEKIFEESQLPSPVANDTDDDDASSTTPTPKSSQTTPRKRSAPESQDTPNKKKLAPAEKILPAHRVAIINAMSTPNYVKAIDFVSVAKSLSEEGLAITTAKLSRHWREVLSADLRSMVNGTLASKALKKQGGLGKKERIAIWGGVIKAYEKAEWGEMEQETGISTTKLKRHLRDVLDKDVKSFINK
ncbi:hypothetical protein M231_06975 [Tremella mesenterica]|uniref:Uncharacterized protein n=1 Tax=Tremella mesenterica TaxID=5217 RepID=A0A4Q1BAI2_TREME|nr:hypothetical protein M231_06975 [Tremella mesenterica]